MKQLNNEQKPIADSSPGSVANALVGSSTWETSEFLYGIKVLLTEKPVDKSILKAVEELNELSVKLLQFINKPESIVKGDIEEEIAD